MRELFEIRIVFTAEQRQVASTFPFFPFPLISNSPRFSVTNDIESRSILISLSASFVNALMCIRRAVFVRISEWKVYTKLSLTHQVV